MILWDEGKDAARSARPALQLNERVQVMVLNAGSFTRASGTVVGRTFEEHPRFDIRLDGGRRLGNVEGERIVRVEGA